MSSGLAATLGIALACTGILAACGKTDGPGASPANVAESKDKGGRKERPLSSAQRKYLTIEPVAASPGSDVIVVPGQVAFRPQGQFSVGPIVAGRITSVLVRNGDMVRAGAGLLTIESSDAAAARASLEQASTRLANAQNLHRRAVVMVEKGVGLEVERQEAETRLNEARAEHDRAQQAVRLLGTGRGLLVTVRAPANGIVTSIRATIGAVVAPGSEPLLELGDPSRLQVVAQVPEGDLRRLTVGEQADVQLPGLGLQLAARVEGLNPRVDPESRRAQVYLALGETPPALRDGMLAQVALRASSEQGVMLPAAAVLIKDGKRRIVYVERPDGSFEAREVQTGRAREGRVAVLSGVAPGERIVVRGALLLDAQAEQLL